MYLPFHRIRILHKDCKGHWEFRYTFLPIRQPVQIHIRAHMHLSGTSLCQCCRLPVKFQVPLAALSRHPHSGGQFRNFLSNIGKTVDITERKIKCLELQYFISEKKGSLSSLKISHIAFSILQSPVQSLPIIASVCKKSTDLTKSL